MRKVSPQTVAKKINALKEELKDLERSEKQSCTFTFTVGEDFEAIRPSYDYKETQKRYMELTEEIRKLRHTMNVFNTSTIVPGFDMTIDQMLCYLPQLRERKQTLKKLKDQPISGRSSGIFEGIVRYEYCNYSVQKATEDYNKIADEYAKAHTALDLINVTGEIEVDW